MSYLELLFYDIWEKGYMYEYNFLMMFLLIIFFYYREYIDKKPLLSLAIGAVFVLFSSELIHFDERIGHAVFDNGITLVFITGLALFMNGARNALNKFFGVKEEANTGVNKEARQSKDAKAQHHHKKHLKKVVLNRRRVPVRQIRHR